MKRLFFSASLLSAVTASSLSTAGDLTGQLTIADPTNILAPYGARVGSACNPYVDYNCEASKAAQKAAASSGECDPYLNYKCLDDYLGDNPLTRFFRYYQLEWGKAVPPADPNAPPAARPAAAWPPAPLSVPPMPFTDYSYGGTQGIGDTRPKPADSPLMVAIANTSVGKVLNDGNIQIYGWINGGFNLSSNKTQPGGNGPIPYTYTPNTAQLDQAVIYVERQPDTVQKDHVDWGFRISGLYGENYRYTNSYGLASYQFNGHNFVNGYDFPMVYADIFIPQIAEGLNIRIGRYISVPDIEAQLAPNNYTYTHSLTYGWDNYTNTGILFSLAATKNLIVQAGLTDGTETPIWHHGATIPNFFPNPLYPGPTMLKDPGNQPSFTFCLRYTSNDGKDTFYPCLDGINNGNWGYNNLQWHGFTYYHKFNEYWHLAFEAYYLSENGIPNLRNDFANQIFANGGTPFSPQFVTYNPPNLAYCSNAVVLACNAWAVGLVAYLNYSPDKLNNFSFRPEFYEDPQGWRTGTSAPVRYYTATLSWQHWSSPQVEFRPEISYWRSVYSNAFDNGTKNYTVLFAADTIIHF